MKNARFLEKVFTISRFDRLPFVSGYNLLDPHPVRIQPRRYFKRDHIHFEIFIADHSRGQTLDNENVSQVRQKLVHENSIMKNVIETMLNKTHKLLILMEAGIA